MTTLARGSSWPSSSQQNLVSSALPFLLSLTTLQARMLNSVTFDHVSAFTDTTFQPEFRHDFFAEIVLACAVDTPARSWTVAVANNQACSMECDVTLVEPWIFRFMTKLNYNHKVVFFLMKILKLFKNVTRKKRKRHVLIYTGFY